MSMRNRPERGNHDDRDAFVKQVAEAETTRLNCYIPTDLHDWLRITAAQGRTDMTRLVVEALYAFRAERE